MTDYDCNNPQHRAEALLKIRETLGASRQRHWKYLLDWLGHEDFELLGYDKCRILSGGTYRHYYHLLIDNEKFRIVVFKKEVRIVEPDNRYLNHPFDNYRSLNGSDPMYLKMIIGKILT